MTSPKRPQPKQQEEIHPIEKEGQTKEEENMFRPYIQVNPIIQANPDYSGYSPRQTNRIGNMSNVSTTRRDTITYRGNAGEKKVGRGKPSAGKTKLPSNSGFGKDNELIRALGGRGAKFWTLRNMKLAVEPWHPPHTLSQKQISMLRTVAKLRGKLSEKQDSRFWGLFKKMRDWK